MRQFVVLAHEVPTTPGLPLDDLPGSGGRVDVVCRAINSALFLSHDLRGDVRVHVVVDDTYTIRFDGATLSGLHPDERSIAAKIDEALGVATAAIGHQPAEAAPGVTIYRMDTAATLEHLAESGSVVVLDPDGTPLAEWTPPPDPVFVISDHQPFTPADRATLDGIPTTQVSVGPRALHGHHVISIAHNYLDTEGYTRYTEGG